MPLEKSPERGHPHPEGSQSGERETAIPQLSKSGVSATLRRLFASARSQRVKGKTEQKPALKELGYCEKTKLIGKCGSRYLAEQRMLRSDFENIAVVVRAAGLGCAVDIASSI